MASAQILQGEEGLAALAGASCAFGVFDGMHLGHRYLIECALDDALAHDLCAVILTFDIDPDELFYPDQLHKLQTNEKRIEMLAQSGVDAVCVLHFDRAFASLLPEDFLEKTFAAHTPAMLHVGCDIRFGARAAGTLANLQAWGSENGMEVIGHPLLEKDGAPITATRIRQLLMSGKSELAAELLGY